MPYEEGIPYVEGSSTSQQAARAALADAAVQRELVFSLVTERRQEGYTRQELVKVTGLKNETICPRVRELMREDRLVELTETRATDAGNQATVLVAPGYVNGRDVLPYEEYRLIKMSAFDQIFSEFDVDWRSSRWNSLRERSKRKGPLK